MKPQNIYDGEVGEVAPGSSIGVQVFADDDGLHFRLTELYRTHREVKRVVMANAGDVSWAAVAEALELYAGGRG